MKWFTTYNNGSAIDLRKIPALTYAEFFEAMRERLANPACHVAHYFGVPVEETRLRVWAILLDDAEHTIDVVSYDVDYYDEDLPSLTKEFAAMHPFERDMTERWGVRYDGMPWDKPLRAPSRSARRGGTIDEYPFYKMESASLHEVNVGPIHAGIIEPGAFRFICNGEKVLHLEISLGYQHRGAERQIETSNSLLRQVLLAEGIAGDSAVTHTTALVRTIEKLASFDSSKAGNLDVERAVALELERMAMHIADTGALCMDVGYQLGQVACEALRTLTINTTQLWCGNRFGKGLIRPFGTNFPLTDEMRQTILKNVAEIRRRYNEVRQDIKTTPSLLSRMEQCGLVSAQQMQRIGGVGQASRASGLARDIRVSHPWGVYTDRIAHQSIIKEQGDVMARLMMRCREVLQAADTITALLTELDCSVATPAPQWDVKLQPYMFSTALVEGWRGECCHVAITDEEGRIVCYRVKDPSMHNWLALALAVRSEGISDFPICNKSFNLSYCGHDL